MREIKFRAWHIPTKKMFDVFSWCKDCVFEDSMDGVGTSPTLPAEAKDCVLMQYTGIKDCNGKEIYEGDIVIPFSLENYNNKSTIVYEFNQFRIKGEYLYWNWDLRQIEVIGNIYENPEM